MEKLETVKELVRANNYKNNDATYAECIRLGIYVNRVGLEQFARKLRAMDHNDEVSEMARSRDAAEVNAPRATLTPFKSSFTPGRSQGNQYPNENVRTLRTPFPPEPQSDNVAPMPIHSPSRIQNRSLNYKEAKQREAEITYELGSIKIREMELIEELNQLMNNVGRVSNEA